VCGGNVGNFGLIAKILDFGGVLGSHFETVCGYNLVGVCKALELFVSRWHNITQFDELC
jgi:hypothetical protein